MATTSLPSGAGRTAVPAYSTEVVEGLRPGPIRVEFLAGLDQAATIVTSRGAAAAATLLREALA
jgi:hypothetical protein